MNCSRFLTDSRKTVAVFFAVGLLAALNRWYAFSAAAASPLRGLNSVPGLDMRTHQELGAVFRNGGGIFTVYRWLVAVCGNLDTLFAVQSLCGVALALLVAWCALRLSGKRKWALLSGFIAATYAPAMLYEQLSLQESCVTFLYFAAFAAVLYADRTRRIGAYALAALALALAASGRPVAVLYALTLGGWLAVREFRRNTGRARWRFPVLWGAATLLVCAVGFFRTSRVVPVYGDNLTYVSTVGRTEAVRDLNVQSRLLRLRHLAGYAGNVLRNLPRLYLPAEIPNNVNYSYLTRKINLGVLRTGPAAVVPLAALAMLLIAVFGPNRWRGVVLLMLLLSLPVAAFVPLARYRLMLYPFFALLGPFPLAFVWRNRRDWKKLGIGTIAATGVAFAAFPVPEFRRAADDFAWGLAMERIGDARAARLDQPPVSYFALAFDAQPANLRHAGKLIQTLLKLHRPDDAMTVVIRARTAGNPAVELGYYAGVIQFGRGKFRESVGEFERVSRPALAESLRGACEFFHGLALLRLGERIPAEAHLNAALALAPTEARRAQIRALLRQLLAATPNSEPKAGKPTFARP